MASESDALTEIQDLLMQIEHRIAIARVLIDVGQSHLLPTLLEDLFADAQTLLDLHCVKPDSV